MEWVLTAIGLLLLPVLLICQQVLHLRLLNVTRQLEKLLDTLIGAALVSYLGLFRAPGRDLGNDRGLTRETLSLGDPTRLSIALAETVESLSNKQPHKPLTTPNMLMQQLPKRPEPKKLPEPPISEEQRQANQRRLAELIASFKTNIQ